MSYHNIFSILCRSPFFPVDNGSTFKTHQSVDMKLPLLKSPFYFYQPKLLECNSYDFPSESSFLLSSHVAHLKPGLGGFRGEFFKCKMYQCVKRYLAGMANTSCSCCFLIPRGNVSYNGQLTVYNGQLTVYSGQLTVYSVHQTVDSGQLPLCLTLLYLTTLKLVL